jgi:DNA-binding XRE family transcriptional regulator
MTQANFAEALGVNQGEIFKIEHRAEIRPVFPIVEMANLAIRGTK